MATAGRQSGITTGITLQEVTIPVVLALLTAAATYFGLRYRYSGRIGSSDAQDLWQESQAMRHELRDEVVRLRTLIGENDRALAECRSDYAKCRSECAELRSQVNALQRRPR